MKQRTIDIIELLRAYIGAFILLWWGIWNKVNNQVAFSDLTGFLSSMGGLI